MKSSIFTRCYRGLIFAVVVLAIVMTSGLAFSGEMFIENPAKYVFLFIGDGMGLAQINAAEIYRGSLLVETDVPTIVPLTISRFPSVGLTTTYDAQSFIPDSASAGTAISCGFKTVGGAIAMDASLTQSFTSLATLSKAKGLKVGIVSSVSIDHATPAVFYANQVSRNMYYEIAMDLVHSDFDFFGGGGFSLPRGSEGDQPDVLDMARDQGYTVVSTREEIMALSPETGKTIAINPTLDEYKALYYEIDRTEECLSLTDFTRKAIEMLEDPDGFFLMVEGGKIDWAGHANDAGAIIHDTLAFDQAVAVAVEFYQRYPEETLIVVTGDHETGGMTLGFAGTGYETFYDIISLQTMSYYEFDKLFNEYKESVSAGQARFEDVLPLIERAFGLIVLEGNEITELEEAAKAGDQTARKKLRLVLTEREQDLLKEAFIMSMLGTAIRAQDDTTYLLYGGYEPLTVKSTRLLSQKAGIGWTSYSHTGIPVATFAQGVGHELFGGFYDNTDIFLKIASIMDLSPVAPLVASR